MNLVLEFMSLLHNSRTMLISGATPKGRNLTPPEVTGEGAFVSGIFKI